jgi:hypothetical protein
MEKQVNWKDTFFDFDIWKTIFDRFGTKSVILYFVFMAMYIISFSYLFERGTSEYIVYVFVFIINALFPLIWIKDLRDFISHVKFDSPTMRMLMDYRQWAMYLALTFQFLALLLVLLKNENVRKKNKINHDEDATRPKRNTLDTDHGKTEKRDKNILIMFVTITTIIWSLIGDTFSIPVPNEFLASEYNTYLIRAIRWLMEQLPRTLHNIDASWLYYMDKIRTTPLIKAFGMYCVVFIVVIFGAFIRIPKEAHRKPHKLAPMKRFDVINIESPFPAKFERNVEDYRNLTLFFLCSLIVFIFAYIMYLLHYFLKVPKEFVQGSVVLAAAIFFGSFFGKRHEILPDSLSVKKLTFFILSVIFSFLGTPVVLAILQLFAEIGVIGGIHKVFNDIYQSIMHTSDPYEKPYTLNHGNMLTILATVIGITLTFLMYGLGVDKGWFDNVDGKPFMMFLAVLITMAISMYMALSTSYPMFTMLYEFLHGIAYYVNLYISPLAIVAFSIVQFVFAYKNNEKYKVYEKHYKRFLERNESDNS